MAIKRIQVNGVNHANINFPDHALAHNLLDGLKGIELGASSHNSFSLPGSINVGIVDGSDTKYQINMNGSYAEIDYEAEADDLPFEADSQEYIISSHVFEHLPNPLKALADIYIWVWEKVYAPVGFVVGFQDEMVLLQDKMLDSTLVRLTCSPSLKFENLWKKPQGFLIPGDISQSIVYASPAPL